MKRPSPAVPGTAPGRAKELVEDDLVVLPGGRPAPGPCTSSRSARRRPDAYRHRALLGAVADRVRQRLLKTSWMRSAVGQHVAGARRASERRVTVSLGGEAAGGPRSPWSPEPPRRAARDEAPRARTGCATGRGALRRWTAADHSHSRADVQKVGLLLRSAVPFDLLGAQMDGHLQGGQQGAELVRHGRDHVVLENSSKRWRRVTSCSTMVVRATAPPSV